MSGADHTPWLMLKMENPKNIGSAGEKSKNSGGCALPVALGEISLMLTTAIGKTPVHPPC